MPRVRQGAGAGRYMKHVAVLMGGWSAERRGVAQLRHAAAPMRSKARGFRVTRVDVGRDIADVLAG